MGGHDRDDSDRSQVGAVDRAYLAAIAAREPVGTAEIAEAVGVTQQRARRRLRQLEEHGAVNGKKIGTALVWSLEEGVVVARHIDPEEDFWEAETYAGEEMSAADIDDILYG